MRIAIDADLPGLADALRAVLPSGLRLTRLSLREGSMEAGIHAPLIGETTLTAEVVTRPGELELHRFRLQGAGLAAPLALSKLRGKIASCDWQRPPLRIWGESDGERLHIVFGAG